MSNLSDNEKKYGITVLGLYKSQSGKTFSGMIPKEPRSNQRDIAEIADLIANNPGGKLVFELVKEEVKEEKGDKFPDAFLKLLTADTVAAQTEEWKQNKDKKQSF